MNGRSVEVAGQEGKALFDRYHERVPFVKALEEQCQRVAENRGYIKTLLGRRCNFPERVEMPSHALHQQRIEPEHKDYDFVLKKRWYTYKALNRLIQGSAADQMKASMLEIYNQGKIPLVTVHDELGISVQSEEEAHKWAKIMKESVKLRVPNKVDVEIGTSWGDSMK
jgi:DNA polymerase I-like protein with 3'-5' exonuclease and polymerase domains